MAAMTRGKGLLEPMLADLRAQRANKLIPSRLRNGRVLDIGCGSFPYFLAHTSFQEKFAIDQIPLPQSTASELKIESYTLDLEVKPRLPFEDNFFEAVTSWLSLSILIHLLWQSFSRKFIVCSSRKAWSFLLHRQRGLMDY